MSNADKPAYPIPARFDRFDNFMSPGEPGFTQREIIAKDMMAAIVSNGNGIQLRDGDGKVSRSFEPKDYAFAACQYADALIEELQKSKS